MENTIILEKQADVLENNNTAQKRLQAILNKTSKESRFLYVHESLHGDLDLSVLTEFGKIVNVSFLSGEITSIRGIPDNIEIFTCKQNLLTEMPKLPSSLKTLQLSGNYFSQVDFSKSSKIESLFLGNNRIEKIRHLPSTLKELHLEKNKLKKLNLAKLLHLKTLNISGNPITVVENMQTRIPTILMTDTPTIDFRYMDEEAMEHLNEGILQGSRAGEEKEAVEGDGDAPTNYEGTVNEAIDTYFRLKSKYETAQHDQKLAIYQNLNAFNNRAARKEARRKIAKLKPKCVKCARPVGTLFSQKDGHYLAICGDSREPCKLRIDIFRGKNAVVRDEIQESMKIAEQIKDDIIETKMKVLFDYKSDATCVKGFEEFMEEYEANEFVLKEYKTFYREHFDNEHKRNEINEKKKQIQTSVESIRGLLDEYKASASTNTDLLKDAVKIHIRDIMPEVAAIRQLENEIMEMEVVRKQDDNKANTYFLFKYPSLLDKITYNFVEPQKVIKMNV
jgi:hypothetical protein